MEILTSFPDRFERGVELEWTRGPERRLLRTRGARRHGRGILLAFEGISDPDGASALAGGELAVPAENAIPPPPDFYYSHEIEGWRCEDTAGRFLGSVRELGEAVAGPLLVFEDSKGKEVLVPFRWPIVAEIDPEAQRIVLDPPEGLLDL